MNNINDNDINDIEDFEDFEKYVGTEESYDEDGNPEELNF